MRIIDSQKLNENLEKCISNDIEQGNIAGASVLVMQNGQTLIRRDFGYAKLPEKIPICTNAVFRLASMTKPITAVAVLQLVEQGKLKLENEVRKYLPQFKDCKVGKINENGEIIFSHNADRDINIMNLLTHTSGLGSSDVGALQMSKIPLSAKKDLKTVTDYYAKEFYLADSPMERVAYSGVAAFDVVSRIVELVADTDYETYLRDNIFSLLGMSDTVFCLSQEQWTRMVDMHRKDDQGSTTYNTGHVIFGNHPLTYFAGGAGLAGTIEDYGIFASMLLNGGILNDVRILSADTLAMMNRSYIPAGTPGLGNVYNWGLGCRIITGEDVLPKGSYGWSGAYGTHFWVDPQNKIIAIYMKNSLYDGGSGAKTARDFESAVMSAARGE